MSLDHPKIVLFGAGVIGGSVGGWVAPHYADIYLLDRGTVADTLRERGITLYEGGRESERTSTRVSVIDRIDQVPDVDVVILGVKNYSLEGAAAAVREQVGDRPLVIGMQNGVENQTILPRFFSRIAYCIVSYNAWMDEPGVIGYQKKGPLYLGTPDNSLREEMEAVARVLSRGVDTFVTEHLNDAAHCKLVLNLTNSVTTLLGLGIREIPDRRLFQKLLTNTLWEGVRVIRAAGYRESRLGGMPPWIQIWAGAKLPGMLTRGLFERNVKKMVMSSMAQDVLQRHGAQSELESLNGYLLELADRNGVEAPYNRAIYELCTREFARPDFRPMDIREVWDFVQSRL